MSHVREIPQPTCDVKNESRFRSEKLKVAFAILLVMLLNLKDENMNLKTIAFYLSKTCWKYKI